jgi:capsular polysaccharide export protein
VGLGKTGALPVSVVLDDRGIYFDARTPSRLEALLMSLDWLTSDRRVAASSGLDRWRHERLSKYNVGKELPADVDRRVAVLVDQVAGDASIPGALATAATFDAMLKAALATYGASGIAIRSHPDVAAGKARGHLTLAARRLGLSVLDNALSAHAVLDQAEAVWTVSSGLGFEAILRGLPVTTFAVPFYAGYGLSTDRADDPASLSALSRRGASRSTQELFAAAFLAYARYADPVTLEPLTLDRAMDRLVDWRSRSRELAGGKNDLFWFLALEAADSPRLPRRRNEFDRVWRQTVPARDLDMAH